MHAPNLFDSFFMGGFECSTHRRRDGRRLDLIAATGHDRCVAQDYGSMVRHGMRTVRDGVRWHLIETTPGHYDWSSFLPMLRASREAGVQVIWDLCHYGWPDDIDIWRPEFVDRFARFAAAVARVVQDEGGDIPFYAPVNEISYWAWAGGDTGGFNPMARGRGMELKVQLVRAAIDAIEAIREVEPRARFVQIDPVINVVPKSDRASDRNGAESYRQAQYQAWDMLVGKIWPGLGGKPDYLDTIGVNYYSDNQWFLGGATIERVHPLYRPFRELLAETHRRYGKPVLVAETGAEGDPRVPWFRYVCDEVFEALKAGVPVEGICLYPVVDYPGWQDERHCATGLLCHPDEQGRRPVYAPLADELARQRPRFEVLRGLAPDASDAA
jgi:beta-glucosidase/6-phospho-beta-glucosidase/beta-galactosidase